MESPLRGQFLDFPRQALHAALLGFKHPRTGQALSFQAPLPADMQALLDALDTKVSGC
jgi:23S rRNA pseudouridine1911/1915/1917 synthase